jgi:hypothetical protein
MKTLLALLLSSTAALADGACFRFVDDPNWTIKEVDGGFLWERGGSSQILTTGSAGTGISTRVATDEDGKMHPYIYVGDSLVIDMQLYTPATCD